MDFPKLKKRRGSSFTAEESAKILEKLPEVDLRAALVGEAYDQAGRRLNATRMLRVEDVEFRTLELGGGTVETVVLTYPEETDKAKQPGTAVLVEPAVSLVRELLRQPAVRATGLLMPMGDLSSRAKTYTPRGKGTKGRGPQPRLPARREWLIDRFKGAEEAAGVPHESGRAYHGLKRRMAGKSAYQREIAARQAGTSIPTMRDTYDPADDLPKQVELAITMLEKRGE